MESSAASVITVEVVYALPLLQTVIRLELPKGATVGNALRFSKIAERHPELDLQSAMIGIYGKQVAHDAIVANLDRIEIYRPLCIDPKGARRARTRPK